MNAFSEGVQEGATSQEYPASVGQGKPNLVKRTSEQTIQNPFLRNRLGNPSAQNLGSSRDINPFTKKPISLSKESSVSDVTETDADVDALLSQCQILPDSRLSKDIEYLYDHLRVRSIVKQFYPIALSPNSESFYYHSSIVADCLLKLDQLEDAESVISKVKRIHNTASAEADSLPGDSPVQIPTSKSGLPILLSVVENEITIKKGREPYDAFSSLLNELWELHSSQQVTRVDELVFRVEQVICSLLMKRCDVESLMSFLSCWLRKHVQAGHSYTPLHFLALRIYAMYRDVSRIGELKSMYLQSLKGDDRPFFAKFIDGVLAGIQGRFTEACGLYENVARGSSVPDLATSAAVNAAVCFYLGNEAEKAARTLEQVIFHDPVNGFRSDVVRNLVSVYNELYAPKESERKRRSLYLLSLKYQVELLTGSDFGIA
ncbi:hypothetical protein WA588_000554 [Blastocystis sp. NMH]